MPSFESRVAAYKQQQTEYGALGGRPTKFTPDLFCSLLRALEAGGTLSAWCRERGVSRRAVQNWARRDAELAAQIEQARSLGCEAIIEEMRFIADTPTSHEQDVQHRKLQLWMREKLLTWHDPKRYGQKQQVQQTVKHEVVLSDTERAIRIKQLLDKAAGKKPQLEIEVAVHEEPSDTEQ